jgi:enoyl-CoA hydratase
MTALAEPTRIRTEKPVDGIGRIVLNRPEKRNAQDYRMLYELDAAFTAAARDENVKVIILAAEGKDFSSGHELHARGFDAFARERELHPPASTWGGFEKPGIEGFVAREEEIYLGFCWKWRNSPKPTIAEVQGHVIGGGLMLVWPCDLIVASDDATFVDPVVALGLNGHEYHVHTWELGHRRAKQMLFTGEPITAQEAYELGMVASVVTRDELSSATLDLARRIARRPSIALMTAKQTVNQAQEAQGLWTALQAAYSLHALGHSHSFQQYGDPIDPEGPGLIRETLSEYRSRS